MNTGNDILDALLEMKEEMKKTNVKLDELKAVTATK